MKVLLLFWHLINFINVIDKDKMSSRSLQGLLLERFQKKNLFKLKLCAFKQKLIFISILRKWTSASLKQKTLFNYEHEVLLI